MKRKFPHISRRSAYILTGLAVVIICAIYFSIDPAASRFVPKCMFHELTGLKCPGCGSQRMLHALLHGDFAEAWRQNALLLIMLPLLIPAVWLEFNRERHPKTYMRVYSIPVVLTVVAIILGWWALRNIIQL